ncbi:MAG TPA: ArsR family transcriptional regulator [Thermoplasmata archaeon]|nr:ArsR family transcriptional regulator [Thermoplasmata archaeon]
MTDPEADPLPTGFSSAKREILLLLKQRPGLSLEDLARARAISKVAALHHLTALEDQGFVERAYEHRPIGRPSVHFRLSDRSRRLFPQAYSQMSLSALGFIERWLGRDAVVRMLQERAHEVADENRSRLGAPELRRRVEALARLRSEGGYMAEVGGTKGSTTEMREHNCPILAIAGVYPEACEVERRMFESMLRARVDTSHRVVAGDPVCRFLVRPRAEAG